MITSLALNLKQPSEEERKLAGTRRDIPWTLRAGIINAYRRNLRGDIPGGRRPNPTSNYSKRSDRSLLKRRAAAKAARLRRETIRPVAGPGSMHNWYEYVGWSKFYLVCRSSGKNRPSKRWKRTTKRVKYRVHYESTSNTWSEQRG